MFVSPWVYSSWKWGGSQESFAQLAGHKVGFSRNPSQKRQRLRVRGTTGAAEGREGGKGVGDDEATQVPAASAKMESGRATTDSERERARKGGEGERGKRRPTSLPVF